MFVLKVCLRCLFLCIWFLIIHMFIKTYSIFLIVKIVIEKRVTIINSFSYFPIHPNCWWEFSLIWYFFWKILWRFYFCRFLTHVDKIDDDSFFASKPSASQICNYWINEEGVCTFFSWFLFQLQCSWLRIIVLFFCGFVWFP